MNKSFDLGDKNHNIIEEDNKSYPMTENFNRSFLDYAFLTHRQLIYEKKTKDPEKIREYNYDLEKTLELNIDLLNKIPLKLEKDEEKDKIRKILENIKNKNNQRVTKKNEIKNLSSLIFNNRQALISLQKNEEEEDKKINKIYEDKATKISDKEKYINILNKRFKDIQNYVELNFRGYLQKNLIDISAFLNENQNLCKEEKMLDSDIKKLSEQITEIKRENKVFQEESKLYQSEENRELVRIIDFYRGLIRSIQTKIKILNNSFDNMTKTLNFLNLGDSKFFFLFLVVNFNVKKVDLSETHYEIDIGDIYDNDDNDTFDLNYKVNNLFDINTVIPNNTHK